VSAVVHSVAALAAVAAAPLDHLGRVEAAPSRVRPAALALIESELWPVWIAAARRRGTPVVRAATDWLRDPIAARAWGVEGRLALRSLRGSAERAAHLVDSVLRMHPARAL